ncbi:leucine-rich repeat protein, partial [Nostoc sp. NIES-2111]
MMAWLKEVGTWSWIFPLIPFVFIGKWIREYFRNSASDAMAEQIRNGLDQTHWVSYAPGFFDISYSEETLKRYPGIYKDNQDLVAYFSRHILVRDKTSQLFFILAPSGMGKSGLLYSIYKKYRFLSYWSFKPHLYYAYAHNIDLAEKLQAFHAAGMAKDTILLIDGLDELGLSHADFKKKLGELYSMTDGFLRTVIAVREQVFDSRADEKIGEIHMVQGGPRIPMRIRLHRLTKLGVRQLLDDRIQNKEEGFNPIERQYSTSIAGIVDKNSAYDFLRNPYMLKLEGIPLDDKYYSYSQDKLEAPKLILSLLDLVVERWYAREQAKIPGIPTYPLDSLEAFKGYFSDLAVRMVQLGNPQEWTVKNLFVQQDGDPDPKGVSSRRSLLKRVDLGGTSYFSFAHDIFLTYFVGIKLRALFHAMLAAKNQAERNTILRVEQNLKGLEAYRLACIWELRHRWQVLQPDAPSQQDPAAWIRHFQSLSPNSALQEHLADDTCAHPEAYPGIEVWNGFVLDGGVFRHAQYRDVWKYLGGCIQDVLLSAALGYEYYVSENVSELAFLIRYNRLKELLLAEWQCLDDTALKNYIPILNSLVALSLGNTKITDKGLENFKGSTELMALLLFQTQITDIGLANFRGCSRLTELCLDQTQVTNTGLQNFRGCTGLKILKLSQTQITNAGLQNFQGSTELSLLDLSQTEISDEALENFRGCTGLKVLILWGTGVTDTGLENLKGCTGLTFLHLGRSKTTNAGFENFVESKHIRELYVWHTGITEKGLARLELASLEKLSIRNTPIRSLQFLHAAPNLRELEVTIGQFPEEELRFFR